MAFLNLTATARLTTFLIFVCAAAHAQEPHLAAIPNTLPSAVRTELATAYAALMSRIDAHNLKRDDFNVRCGRIPSAETVRLAACRQEYQTVIAEENALEVDKKQFAARLSAAVEAAKATEGIQRTAASAASRFCAAKLKVAADEQAIRQMNFANEVRTFEMFGDLSAKQRAQMQTKVLDALLEQGLDATVMAADSRVKSLNPYNVNTTIRKLRAQGLNNDAIFAGLRRVAGIKGKPEMAAAYKELLDMVTTAKEGYEAGQGMAEDAKNANLRLLLGVLKVAQGNPELGLAVTAADFGESLAYLGYISVQVNDLTRVTDNKLSALNSRIDRLKQDVNAVKAARQDWAGVSGTAGTPDCQR